MTAAELQQLPAGTRVCFRPDTLCSGDVGFVRHVDFTTTVVQWRGGDSTTATNQVVTQWLMVDRRCKVRGPQRQAA